MSIDSNNDWQLETLAVRAGQERSQFNEHSEALYLTSSFVFENAAQAAAYVEQQGATLVGSHANFGELNIPCVEGIGGSLLYLVDRYGDKTIYDVDFEYIEGRKPGDNAEPISHTHESFPVQKWQKYASPVWMDINPSDTLQYRSAREHDDERHICPLQLDVIRRGVRLWTNPGDVVLSPFMGIGSEGFVSLELGRKFVGVELKKSYFDQAVKNLQAATKEAAQDLFAMAPAEA